MMSMVYLSSRPLTQADFDAEEICPGLLVEVGCMALESGKVCYFQILY